MFSLPLFTLILCQINDFNPGKHRWSIKTSIPKNRVYRISTFDELLRLPYPIKKDHIKYQFTRIPFPVGDKFLKEGDIVTIYAYIHLVATEKDEKNRDGDYHIQVLGSSGWKDSCLIVEVPIPDFVKNKALSDSCAKVRKFIRHHMLFGKEPAIEGTILLHPAYVKITGQLFLDSAHLGNKPRGKRNRDTGEPMKSYTCWEIHPVIHIEFANLPTK